MAAREGLVGSLSRGRLLPLPWKQSGTTRAMEGRGGKREGAERSSAGNSEKPRARVPPMSPRTWVHLPPSPCSAALPPLLYLLARCRCSGPLKSNFATSSGNPTVRHFRKEAGIWGDELPARLGLTKSGAPHGSRIPTGSLPSGVAPWERAAKFRTHSSQRGQSQTFPHCVMCYSGLPADLLSISLPNQSCFSYRADESV